MENTEIQGEVLKKPHPLSGRKQTAEHIANRAKALRGIPLSEETKRKLSIVRTGRKQSPETIAKRSASLRGRKRTTPFPDEVKQKIANTLKGNKNALGNKSRSGRKNLPETNAKISAAHKGRKHSEEFREMRRKLTAGIPRPERRVPYRDIRQQIRQCMGSKEWKQAVLKRDNYTCVQCGCKKNLHVDHFPIPFFAILNKLIVEQGIENLYDKAIKYDLLFDMNNGRTLCVDCHKQTETWGFHGKKKMNLQF